MTGRGVVTLVLVLTLATGCAGDSDGDANGGRSPDSNGGDGTETTEDSRACALLSQIEVSEAVGIEVGPGRPSGGNVATGGSQSTCEWFSVEEPTDTAKLTIYSDPTAADSVKEADPDAEPLPGVGDEAFVGAYASVWVYKDGQSFMAQWYSMAATDDESLPKSEALARLAADRL